MGGRVIQDGVGILAGSNLRFDFQCFQIEDGDLGGSALADKTNAEVGGDSDTVYAGSVRNVTDDRPSFRIQHGHVGGSPNVNAVSVWIDGNVVPASTPFEREFFRDFEVAPLVTSA